MSAAYLNKWFSIVRISPWEATTKTFDQPHQHHVGHARKILNASSFSCLIEDSRVLLVKLYTELYFVVHCLQRWNALAQIRKRISQSYSEVVEKIHHQQFVPTRQRTQCPTGELHARMPAVSRLSHGGTTERCTRQTVAWARNESTARFKLFCALAALCDSSRTTRPVENWDSSFRLSLLTIP